MMMLTCIKQHASDIWSSVHEKVEQQWGWVEKSVAYDKNMYWSGTNKMSKQLFSKF